MLTTFVLLLYVDGYKTATTISQEFNNKEACEYAVQQFDAQFTDSEITFTDSEIKLIYVCVPKD